MIVFGNRVLCLVVLFLLQSAGCMAMAEEEPLISVVIKDHTFSKHESIKGSDGDYDISRSECAKKGNYVISAYTKAIRETIVKLVHSSDKEGIFVYIGADMEYSAHKEPDTTKRCDYAKPSLNCIIKWNQGAWADALGDGVGVGFYKGDPKSVDGSGPINGYDVTVESSWGVTKKPYIGTTKSSSSGFSFLIHNDNGLAGLSKRAISGLVCEVQGVIIKRTEAPNNTSQSAGSEVSGAPDGSDGQSGWSSGAIAAVVIIPILLVILAVVLCLYYYGYIRWPRADDRPVTEDPTAANRTDRNQNVRSESTEDPNTDSDSDDEMNPLEGDDEQRRRRRTMSRNTFTETPQQANAMARADSGLPSDSDVAAEKQTRRRRPIPRTRSKMWTLHMSAAEAPIAGEIVKDTVDEWH